MKLEHHNTTNPNNQPQEAGFDLSKADLDEIVFRYRNKAYGAFLLRKLYPRHMLRATLLACLLLLLVLNSQAIVNAILGINLLDREKNIEVDLTEVRYVEAERHLPQAPIVEQSAPQQRKDESVKPNEKDKKPKPNLPVIKKEETKTEASDETTKEGSSESPADGKNDDGTTKSEIADTPTPEKPVSTGEPQKVLIEEVPSYSGGEKEMLRFIYSNIRYPDAARDAGVEGIVYITFIIEKDGTVSNVVIKQDLPKGCGNEAARVVRLMPKWVPGKLKGRPIRAMFTLPIEFKLLGEK